MRLLHMLGWRIYSSTLRDARYRFRDLDIDDAGLGRWDESSEASARCSHHRPLLASFVLK